MSIDDFMSEEEYVAQMYTGALLNPRIDSTFKALFTQPTKESRSALKSFLEAATEHKIKSFELANNDAPEEFFGQRRVSYDIMCIFDDGEAADIEMQAFNQEYDYGKRAEYQVSRLETTYLKKGDTWEKAPKVYQITVLDFIYTKIDEAKPETKKAVSRYSMRTKDGLELTNALNIVFIELPKVKGLEKSLDTNTQLENWALFLKDADNPKKNNVIKELTSKEAGLMSAQQSLSSISANQSLWITQYRQELADRDYRSSLSVAMNKGILQGRSEGLLQGRKEGRNEGLLQGRSEGLLQGRTEAARNALKLGFTLEQVAQITGLSLDDLSSL